MRTIERTGQFEKDFRREAERKHRATRDADLRAVLVERVADRPLAASYRDHALSGDRRRRRDCHVKPDLVLIYPLADTDTLRLVRLGSHAEPDL